MPGVKWGNVWGELCRGAGWGIRGSFKLAHIYHCHNLSSFVCLVDVPHKASPPDSTECYSAVITACPPKHKPGGVSLYPFCAPPDSAKPISWGYHYLFSHSPKHKPDGVSLCPFCAPPDSTKCYSAVITACSPNLPNITWCPLTAYGVKIALYYKWTIMVLLYRGM
jgi:hypothetical protein